MSQTIKNKERSRPVVTRSDLKYYVRLESQKSSRLHPFHRRWTLQNFIQILRVKNVMAHSYVRVVNKMLEKEEVIGFILYRLHEDRFEILNLIVEPDRPDVVNELLALIKNKTDNKRRAIEFTVRETDEEWHNILRMADFQAKLVRGHFDYPVEDGYKFRWEGTCYQ